MRNINVVLCRVVAPVLKNDVAGVPWPAAAAGHTAPAAGGMTSGSRRGDAAGEVGGRGRRTQEATDLTAPERLRIQGDGEVDVNN